MQAQPNIPLDPGHDMVWISSGVFLMGSDNHYPEEAAAHHVEVKGFWIDTRAITNAEFERFVTATGYITVAERPLDPALYPNADPKIAVPGALVFHMTAGPVDTRHIANWWSYVPGACWKRPEGPRALQSPGGACRVRRC